MMQMKSPTLTVDSPTSLPLAAEVIDLLTIGELAKQSGVTVRTIRYYEEVDLIAPSTRSSGRYRLYHPRTLKRVVAIVALQDLHFSLDEVLAMLGPASVLKVVADKQQRTDHSRQALLRQQASIDLKLEQLQALQADISQRLSVLSTDCAPCLERQPDWDCHAQCQHREVHVD
jgi:DNA-binding transcriptional MerR regulator